MRIVAGVECSLRPAKSSSMAGQSVEFTSIAQALKLGISLIHQELNLAENLGLRQHLPGPRAHD